MGDSAIAGYFPTFARAGREAYTVAHNLKHSLGKNSRSQLVALMTAVAAANSVIIGSTNAAEPPTKTNTVTTVTAATAKPDSPREQMAKGFRRIAEEAAKGAAEAAKREQEAAKREVEAEKAREAAQREIEKLGREKAELQKQLDEPTEKDLIVAERLRKKYSKETDPEIREIALKTKGKDSADYVEWVLRVVPRRQQIIRQ